LIPVLMSATSFHAVANPAIYSVEKRIPDFTFVV
jgi:hypothetical protein